MKRICLLAPLFLSCAGSGSVFDASPGTAGQMAPFGAVPSARQLAWHDQEFYAFVHFNMNTFTGVEWGHGEETADTFQPTDLDCEQWCKLFSDCGLTGVILTVKHHDGFCLWPSDFTDHDVASSSWRSGQGDVLRELERACRKYGLNLGVYISPWDQNNPLYGKNDEAYNDYFVGQLTELLTGYGEISEVWWDGANGDRNDPEKHQEYDWPRFIEVVRELQPSAVIFSDDGPDVRWVGNERGFANPTQWSTIFPPREGPMVNPGDGDPGSEILNTGEEGGTRWLPAEVDVSIRPGWYWHPDTDDMVKSVDKLLDIYYESVGHNANLLLNFPVDARGLVHENDAAALRGMTDVLEATFDVDLAAGCRATSSNERRGGGFEASNVTDGDPETFWALDDGQAASRLLIELGGPRTFNRLMLQEHIELGQRVRSWSLEARVDGSWRQVVRGTTIGHKRLARFDTIRADAVRLVIEDSLASPTIETVSLFSAPAEVLIRPEARVFLDQTTVAMATDFPGWSIHYTLDGSSPTESSPRYARPFVVRASTVVRAVAVQGSRVSPRSARVELVGYKSASLLRPRPSTGNRTPGLRVERYEGGWQTLDAMGEREPVSATVEPNVGVGPRSRDEHAALTFAGLLRVPADGIYSFYLTSDDGSRLWIGAELLIDNDGLHGMVERTGQIGLRAGEHPLHLEWFNATGGLGLKLEWSGPGIPRGPVPDSAFVHEASR